MSEFKNVFQREPSELPRAHDFKWWRQTDWQRDLDIDI